MDRTPWQILMVDDDLDDQHIVRGLLGRAQTGRFVLHAVDTYAQGIEALRAGSFDAALVDYRLGPDSGLDFLRQAAREGCPTPILLLTGQGSYEIDLEAMQAGAADYLNKNDLNPALLERALRYAVERRRSQQETRRLLDENRRQAGLFERVMQDAASGIAVLRGPDYRHIIANPHYERLTGGSGLVGQTLRDAWGSQITAQLLPLLDQVRQTGQPYQAVDMPFELHLEGRPPRVYATFRLAPLFDEAGAVDGIVVNVDNTTPQVLERQQARAWEETLHSFFDSEGILAAVIELEDGDLRFVRANERLARFYQLTPEQIRGRLASELDVDPASLAGWIEQYRRSLAGQQPVSWEYSFTHRRQTGWYYATISPIDSPNGAPRFAFVAVDLSEHKRSEQALAAALQRAEEERNRLRAVMQALPVGVSICDAQGGVILANEAYHRVWGGPPPETRSVDDYHAFQAWWADSGQPLPPDDWASAQALRHGVSVLGQFLQIQRFDGTRAYVLNSAAPVFDASGSVVGSCVAIQDVTARVQAEHALRASEARYKIMGETVPYGVWLAGADGQLQYASQSFLDLLGLRLADLQTAGWPACAAFKNARRLLARWRRCLETGEEWDQELQITQADGARRTVWSRGKPVRGPDGKITSWVGLNLDVTDRKRREEHAHFLARLGNRLVGMTDPDAVLRLVCEQTGLLLGASVCLLSEEDWHKGSACLTGALFSGGRAEPLNGQFPIDTFPPHLVEALRAGQRVVVEDAGPLAAAHGRQKAVLPPGTVGSFVLLPRLLDGRWAGTLILAARRPRRWQPDVIELLESVANLAWLALDQSRAGRDLQITEERFRVALQNAPITVFSQDANLRYTWVYNPHRAFDDLAVIGKTDADLLDPEAAALLTAHKQAVLDTGQRRRAEVRYRIAGELVYYDLTLEPLRDAAGAVAGLTGAALDLTHLRRLEAEQVAVAAQIEVQRRLIQQRELERMDIARDLHDGVLQELTALSFGLAEAVDIEEKAARIEKLRWVQAALQAQAREIRAFCNDLRPPALAPFGLEKAVQSHAAEFARRHPSLTLHLDLAADRQALPENTRMALFRVYQEVLNNIARHASASQVWVTWRLDEDQAVLEIADDGVGYVVPTDWVAQARSGHLGLLGIRERVQSVGGAVAFESQPGSGARVRVTVPRDGSGPAA